MTPSRRTFLGLGALAAGAFTVAACSGSDTAPGPISNTGDTPAAPATGSSSDSVGEFENTGGTLTSRFWPGQDIEWRLARPARPKALVIALHGKGGSADDWFDALGAPKHAADTGLAIASIDGGNYFWHDRAEGVDTGALVREKFIPFLAARGVPTEKIAMTGLSMGGFGAMLLATELPREQVFGVATMSAALWLPKGRWSSDAFDDDQDYREHNVWDRVDTLRELPVSIACGFSDQFIDGNRTMAGELDLPKERAVFAEGEHSDDYWARAWGPQLHWLASLV